MPTETQAFLEAVGATALELIPADEPWDWTCEVEGTDLSGQSVRVGCRWTGRGALAGRDFESALLWTVFELTLMDDEARTRFIRARIEKLIDDRDRGFGRWAARGFPLNGDGGINAD